MKGYSEVILRINILERDSGVGQVRYRVKVWR